MKYKFVTAFIALIASLPNSYEARVLKDLSERYSGLEIDIYDSCELSPEIIEGRESDRLLVERCVGIATTSDGDGRIVIPYDEDYDYLSYASCEGVLAGDVVLSYFIYNPETFYMDDILERYDYVISREMED